MEIAMPLSFIIIELFPYKSSTVICNSLSDVHMYWRVELGNSLTWEMGFIVTNSVVMSDWPDVFTI